MKEKKIKTHVLTVSRFFPATHKRKGEPTNFVHSIMHGEKIHTIRGNFPLWEKRIKEVQNGEAVLSLRFWTGAPYKSPQQEFIRFDKSSGIGVQEINVNDKISFWTYPELTLHYFSSVAKNDGLSLEDFEEWFKKVKKGEELAIIHFTKLRYK